MELPGTKGSGGLIWYSPFTSRPSKKPMPTPPMRSLISPLPGERSGRSETRSALGSPKASTCSARMLFPLEHSFASLDKGFHAFSRVFTFHYRHQIHKHLVHRCVVIFRLSSAG